MKDLVTSSSIAMKTKNPIPAASAASSARKAPATPDRTDSLAAKLDSLEPSERRLARLVAFFPPAGAEKFVFRHLWTDYLEEPAASGGKETFDAVFRRLVRIGAVEIDETGERVRVTPAARRILLSDPDGSLREEAAEASDFLAAWLGFTPFGHARLRRFAETSLLGRELAKETGRIDQIRAERVQNVRTQTFEAAREAAAGFRPDGRHSPLVWAEFLEQGDDVVFPGGNDPHWVRANLRRFLRRHWVYAFLNRGYGPLVDGLFDDAIQGWNFFDRLVALQNGAASAERLFADRPEWREETEEILRRMAESD